MLLYRQAPAKYISWKQRNDRKASKIDKQNRKGLKGEKTETVKINRHCYPKQLANEKTEKENKIEEWTEQNSK